MNSHYQLTPESEFRYILNWFREFSEYEKADFMAILIQWLLKNSEICVNGIIEESSMASEGKPLSIFLCRVSWGSCYGCFIYEITSNVSLTDRSSYLKSGHRNGRISCVQDWLTSSTRSTRSSVWSWIRSWRRLWRSKKTLRWCRTGLMSFTTELRCWLSQKTNQKSRCYRR